MAREGRNMRWLWPCRCMLIMLVMCPERPPRVCIVVGVRVLLQRVDIILEIHKDGHGVDCDGGGGGDGRRKARGSGIGRRRCTA